MTTAKDFQPATGRWDAFALAAAAPLGSFAHAHLAPKIPPALLNSALATYLPLQDDELLLAIIDGGGRKPAGCCALTTRRCTGLTTDDRRRTAHAAAEVTLPHPLAQASIGGPGRDYADLPGEHSGRSRRPTDRPASTWEATRSSRSGRATNCAGGDGGALSRDDGSAARAGPCPKALIDADLGRPSRPGASRGRAA